MTGTRGNDLTSVVLSFCDSHVHWARRLAAHLQAANLEVKFDQWDGGGGVASRQAVKEELVDAAIVVPLLTRSKVGRTWISEEWKREVYDKARSKGIDVLPVYCETSTRPEFLSHLSYADLCNRDYDLELRRLIQTIRKTSGDTRISTPEVEGEKQKSSTLFQLPAEEVGLELASDLGVPIDQTDLEGFLAGAMFPTMLSDLFWELGVRFPDPSLHVRSDLAPCRFRVVLNGIPQSEATVRLDRVVVDATVDEVAGLGIDAEPAFNPLSGVELHWISDADVKTFEREDLSIWTWDQYLMLVLASALRQKASDFISVGAASKMLVQIEPVFPNLVAESVPKAVPLFIFTDVLRRLVAERVSIRDMRRILMVLADWGRVEQDPDLLTDYVRAELKRAITHQHCFGTDQLFVLLLVPEIEHMIRDSMRHTPTGSYLDLPADSLEAIMKAIREPLDLLPAHAQRPSILVPLEIRSLVQRLIAPLTTGVGVVSYQDILSHINIQPIGRIELDGFSPRKGVKVGRRAY